MRICGLLLVVFVLTGAYTLRTPEAPTAQTSPLPLLADGEAIYNEKCMSCHQTNGTGVPGVFPPLVDSRWVEGSHEWLVRIILQGIHGPIEVNGMTYSGVMPPWGGFLNDEEVAALATYVRTSWGNDASPVTTEQVTAIREATSDRKDPWTAEELLEVTGEEE